MNRHLGAPAEGQSDADRERGNDAGRGDDQGHEEAAPLARLDDRQRGIGEDAAADQEQQDESDSKRPQAILQEDLVGRPLDPAHRIGDQQADATQEGKPADIGQPGIDDRAAVKKVEGKDREGAEEENGIQHLVGQRGDQQGTSKCNGDQVGEIDPPARLGRIEAVHELAELCPDEGPASSDGTADLVVETCIAVGPRPHRADNGEIDEGQTSM